MYGVVLVWCLHFADDKSESSLNMYAIEIRLHHFHIYIGTFLFFLQKTHTQLYLYGWIKDLNSHIPNPQNIFLPIHTF